MVNFGELNVILDLTFAIIAFIVIDCVMFVFLNRRFSRYYLVITEVVAILCWMFNLHLLETISFVLWACGMIFFSFANMADIRVWIANGLSTTNGKIANFFKKDKDKIEPETLINREQVYKEVEDAVTTLSRQKIGALITFERHDKLDDIMKNGTKVNAPVTSELLQTIFYPGTRLHDGAVIIRDDKIVAASVYFTPTKRPLFGKYGSRHRAAYGISEISDSVTVIVSEETGRISIGFQGDLTPVTPDTFLRIFEEDMNIASQGISKKNN